MTLRGFPRLADADALVRLHETVTASKHSPERVTELVMFDHPNAHPVPTGALIASTAAIKQVRTAVLAEVSRWLTNGRVAPRNTSRFDIALGRALHQNLQILPADAAHRSTWNFLTAMVFPDLAWARFPDLHEDRFLGTQRNALRRPWQREDILGDLLHEGPAPLGEDELVGLLERTALARNRRLVVRLAKQVLGYGGPARSAFARDLYKRATLLTGPLLLDAITDAELDELILELAEAEPSTPPEVVKTSSEVDGPESLEAAGRHRAGSEDGDDVPPVAKPTGDIVRQFHEEMTAIFARTLDETGYRASPFFRMVTDLGGVEAAKRLLGMPAPSEGFTALWEHGRLDLSAEALASRPEYRGLFGDDLVERAIARLREFGYDVDQTETT